VAAQTNRPRLACSGLVRHAEHGDGWGTVGGAVEPGESPAAAAVREAREELGVDIRLVRQELSRFARALLAAVRPA
jgi:8-oxo-dGTP pyrophosphatase MutT (NUDIX family)